MYGSVGADLDETEVALEKEYLCGKCQKKMVQIAQNKFKCPNCGSEYTE